MSIELTCLLWSAALGFVYLMTQAALANTDNVGGIEPNRDREPQFGLRAQRAGRALRNFLETYPLFIALVVVAEIANRHGALTHWGAILYLVVRVVYLPLYLVGGGIIRSAVWSVALLGLVLMFIGILL
ncbi:MAPEG family protein [Rhizobium sp. C4]|uniref:MAPEG family protein n=1 Tax=Rhizobium sp. C4 TaxID=1349800 RepID=UPI001E2ED875|nr:MAPEG family protein [Rhizobium sp. C4]MCD2175465.1 MAPEG family protein [Rhizobium sp. C4]